MSLVMKMQKGDKTPTLYTMYDKKYDFNDLQQRADLGLVDYLGTLKRGSKDRELFMEAYSNIMSGIKDGTITFLNGRYVDSTGRYYNKGKGNKDHYGLMASYIYNLLNSSKEYIKPEDKTKIKWDNGNGISIALNRALFNSDNGNILDFIDLDKYDETTKKRLTTNRGKRLALAIHEVLGNFDQFTEFTDADRLKYLDLGDLAAEAINDGTIDAGDYMALSRFANGLNYRVMFGDGITQQPDIKQSVDLQTVDESQQIPSFTEWVLQNYAPFTGSLRPNISLVSNKKYGQNTLDTLFTAMGNLKDDDILDIINSCINGLNYIFNNDSVVRNTFKMENLGFPNEIGLYLSLLVLKDRGLLQKIEGDGKNLYYIPGTTTKRNTGFVYDRDNNQIIESSIHDIPYFRDKIVQKYFDTYGKSKNDEYWKSRYASYFKNGGIIKAWSGIKFSTNANWYSGVFTPLLNHILEGLGKDNGKDYALWLNDMLDKHFKIYDKAKDSDYLNKAYTTDGNYISDYQNMYKTGFNGEWDGTDAEGIGYNSIGIRNSKSLGMFDKFGNTKRTSGDWNEGGNNWNTDNLFSGITDYRRLLGREGDFDLEQLETVKLNFKEKGYDFVKGENGYYKLVPLEKQVAVETPEEPLEEPLQDTGNESYINTTKVKAKTKGNFNLGEFALGLAPDLIGAGRLFDSLRTNNRAADTLRKPLISNSLNTYELYSLVTGAFSKMLFKNRLAADVRGQADRPFTSDASLTLAGKLDANRQATDLEYQGFLADDKEISRTQAEALKRLEDNVARRTDVANKNRSSINQTNREIAELEATRLRRNWQSRDNFLQGIESRMRLKYDTNKERRDNFRLQTAMNDIETEYLDAISGLLKDKAKWERDNNGSDISTWSGYDNYINMMKAMNRWKNALTYGAHARVYGYGYTNRDLGRTAKLVAGDFHYKHGGTLRPSSMYLINKVIRNESNS